MSDNRDKVVGLFFKHDRSRSAQIARAIETADYGSAKVRFVVGEAGGNVCTCDDGRPKFLDDSRDFEKMACAVSIGGDGTFLRTARLVRELGIPLYGINTGRLGFLASGAPERAVMDVTRILAGDYRLMKRVPLRGELVRGDGTTGNLYALNEIALTKGSVARPIDLRVRVCGHDLYRFLADGIIVATPTGSTAYALSAGGPVVQPGVNCLVVVPICPHSLYPRPAILAEEEVIEIELAGDSNEMFLSGDSQLSLELSVGDRVRLMLDREKPVYVIRLDETSYFEVLQSKMSWGHRGECADDAESGVGCDG